MPGFDPAAGALTRRLELAVDAHDLARDGRGIGTYARAVLARFVRRDDLRVTLLVREWFPRRFAAALRAAIGADTSTDVRVANRVPRDADVLWHPWNGTFFSARARSGAAIPAVATIHDLVPFALPADDPGRRESQQAPFRRTAREAREILCDSQFTAAEAHRYLAVERSRLHVVPLGIDPIFSPGAPDALPARLRGRRYLLYVGAHDAHKNVMTLVAAQRAEFGDAIPLVFTRANALVPEAVVCANVDLPTLVALYRGAWLVAVPSVYEGFGLPVLEAMGSGAPVLASRAASLPEVGADAAAYVDEPRDVAAWRAALRRLHDDDARRHELARGGPARAALFSWDTCAEQTLDVLWRRVDDA